MHGRRAAAVTIHEIAGCRKHVLLFLPSFRAELGRTPDVGALRLLPLCLRLAVFLFPFAVSPRWNIIVPGCGRDRLFVSYPESAADTGVSSDDRDIINRPNGANRAFRGIIGRRVPRFISLRALVIGKTSNGGGIPAFSRDIGTISRVIPP